MRVRQEALDMCEDTIRVGQCEALGMCEHTCGVMRVGQGVASYPRRCLLCLCRKSRCLIFRWVLGQLVVG
jgi:hypothetical protein